MDSLHQDQLCSQIENLGQDPFLLLDTIAATWIVDVASPRFSVCSRVTLCHVFRDSGMGLITFFGEV